ncbi:MAG TPA: deoxyguanosinetriphosphate triphosphohydrolase [Candidatus Blautia faecavium]|uniref:Deoxyguanosinetriphosphate triphosphohydrolase-like protein n=1 Tax=Candidatus Blautia faecavium TaxID=2838487 RepID=A0A9D2LU52_9FIRM|nr:deoxyguanosinetriphosphate triphosphohydrolase [Candidatus Blautia faecavium]
MNIRESMEQRELALLSPFAAHSLHSKGRERQEEECDIRTVYQRDRDRILHCKAFRRLKDKTQVFLAPQGDHYRNRLTHTLEVSQIARTIAKALRLNEDLVEAIALGHDLGHTPFGHAGERALNEVHPDGFAHYKQSVRVVEVLEKNGRGLNLTWEVRNGILNHRTSGSPATLEGQVVRYSDKIAYIHHDMDDAQRAGIITEDDIPITLRMLLGYTTRERLNTFVHDIIENSMDKDSIQMSQEIQEAMMDLRRIMFRNVYENPVAKKEEQKAIKMLTELYEYYIEHPEAMSREYRELILHKGVKKSQAVCDYLSGMTDQYSMDKFREIYIPKAWEVY